MHHVHFERDYTTLLTKREILNPFLVLQEIYSDQESADSTRETLLEIVSTALCRDRWKRYAAPLILMNSYRKLVRLMEAGWLIQQVIPSHDLFISSSVCAMRLRLYEFFFTGMDPSCTSYPYDLESNDMTFFEELDRFLISIHNVHVVLQSPELTKNAKIMLKEELAARKHMKTLYIYYSALESLFGFISKGDLIQSIERVPEILMTNDYWRSHEHPADLIYHFHNFLFLLESFWNKWRKAKKKYPISNDRWISSLTEGIGIRPSLIDQTVAHWKFLEECFKKRSLEAWREDLDTCQLQALSNIGLDRTGLEEYAEILDLIRRLIELAGIYEYGRTKR